MDLYEEYKNSDKRTLHTEAFLKDLMASLRSLRGFLDRMHVKYVIIGGAAKAFYGRNVITEDIDILVSSKDRERLINDSPAGFNEVSRRRGKVFRMYDPVPAKIEVIYSGEISGDGVRGIKYPEPQNVTEEKRGFPVIRLDAYLAFKITAGLYGGAHRKHKDFQHVIDTILDQNLREDYFKDSPRADVRDTYQILWNEANAERSEIDRDQESGEFP